MTSRAFLHHILAFTVLFASSFAAFHGSEHIAIGKADSTKVSFTTANSDHFHSESEHHDFEETGSPEKKHSIESLCEVCLILSNLTAYALGYTYLDISPEKTNHRLFNLAHSKRHSFLTYLSRAPPRNA